MKKTILLASVAVATVCLMRCSSPSGSDGVGGARSGSVTPVPFPDSTVTGITFPTDSNIINGWLATNDSASIAAHGWGIWAGLTANSGDSVDGQPLLVYETWLTPTDLQDSLNAAQQLKSTHSKTRRALRKPRQFEHASRFANARIQMEKTAAKGNKPAHQLPCDSPQYSLGVFNEAVTVSYDPPAANHILSNKLYDTSVLQGMLNNKMTDIPDFPNTSIALKPTYQIIPKSKLVAGFFAFRVWSGPNNCDSGYGQSQWQGVVYVDTKNNSGGDGSVDMANKGRTTLNTYNLNSFINYTLTQEEANVINQLNEGFTANAGDIAILVGMHVTSKEIKRWTWQTFWWTPNATNPPAPSSAFIASKKSPKLSTAAAHYAMAIGYTFIMPNQPYTGGSNVGASVIAFNPFLEATFGDAGTHAVFYAKGLVVNNKGVVTSNNVGCQTNCMSCHALATYFNNGAIATVQQNTNTYIPDTYIDMVKDSMFTNNLKLDFLYSIQSSLLPK